MAELVVGDMRVLISVAEEKTKDTSALATAVIRKECRDSGKSFAKTWIEAHESATGR